jgi:phosphate-selective porin OprO/OprP
MTLATGGFRLTNNFGNGFGNDSPYDINARVTGLPIYEPGSDLLHLGFSYAHKFRDSDPESPGVYAVASRPESRLFPTVLVNTGVVDNNGSDQINPEIAYARGPFSVQGEWTWSFVDQVEEPNPTFSGGYVEGSWFVTGESRASFYRTPFGHFDRVIPIENFAFDGGPGAWQLAVRYSYLDLSSDSVRGGTLDDLTAGVNWYLNPLTRFTINYIWAHRQSIGNSNIVQGRFQLTF